MDGLLRFARNDGGEIEMTKRQIDRRNIKLMKEDAAGVEAMTEEIKTRYTRLFRV
jgi:hypothetical protein